MPFWTRASTSLPGCVSTAGLVGAETARAHDRSATGGPGLPAHGPVAAGGLAAVEAAGGSRCPDAAPLLWAASPQRWSPSRPRPPSPTSGSSRFLGRFVKLINFDGALDSAETPVNIVELGL